MNRAKTSGPPLWRAGGGRGHHRQHRHDPGDLRAAGVRARRIGRPLPGAGVCDHLFPHLLPAHLPGPGAHAGLQVAPISPAPGRPSWIQDAGDAFFTGLENAYRGLLRGVLNHRWTTVFIAAVLLVGSLLLLPWIGSDFLPPGDEGEVRVTGEMEVGARLDIPDRQIRRMEAIVKAAVPEAASTVTSVGASGGRPDRASREEIRMSPLHLAEGSLLERRGLRLAGDEG